MAGNRGTLFASRNSHHTPCFKGQIAELCEEEDLPYVGAAKAEITAPQAPAERTRNDKPHRLRKHRAFRVDPDFDGRELSADRLTQRRRVNCHIN